MTALIVLLIVIAFVCARIMRSTRTWWACIIAILAGLLIGLASKYVISDSNDELTVITTDFSSNHNEYIQCTFDDAFALLEETSVVGYTYYEEPKRLTGYNSKPIIGAREPPEIVDDS